MPSVAQLDADLARTMLREPWNGANPWAADHQAAIDDAKLEIRTEIDLPGWSRRGYAQSLDLKQMMQFAAANDTFPRVDSTRMSPEQFYEQHQRTQMPAVISGLCAEWPANTEWTPAKLSDRFAGIDFRVGSDDDGDAVEVPMDAFWWYAEHGDALRDDNPVYLFDREFEDAEGAKTLVNDYSVPPYFQDDLFQLVNETSRPPYRWVVMGPARSGSAVHTDPLETSAWNALLSGHKYWVLYPPETPKGAIKPQLQDETHIGGAPQWFTDVLPKTFRPEWPHARPIVILQRPGETMYVPAGWWHAVLNLDTTIAVTHNLAEVPNFDKIWETVARKRTDIVAEWLTKLAVQKPELSQRAEAFGGLGAVQRMCVEHRKLKTRSCISLAEWSGQGYAQRLDLSAIAVAPDIGQVDRFRAADQMEAATEQVMRMAAPLVLEGAAEGWRAKQWSLGDFVERFGKQKMRVGSDDQDDSVKMRLNDYAWYCSTDECAADDNPMQVGARPVGTGSTVTY